MGEREEQDFTCTLDFDESNLVRLLVVPAPPCTQTPLPIQVVGTEIDQRPEGKGFTSVSAQP